MHHSDLPLARINEIRLSSDKVVRVVQVNTVNGEYVSLAENFCLQTVVVS